jgi:hypothetical protein
VKTIDRQAASAFRRGRVLIAAVLLLCAATLFAAPPAAQAATQNAGSYSITVTGCNTSVQTLTAYRIASWENGGLVLDESLAQAKEDTGIDVTTFDRDTDAATLRKAATTYAGYVAEQASHLKSYQATVSNGTAAFQNVEPGMYVIPETTATKGNTKYDQSPLLIPVPSPDENGNLISNVTVAAKTSATKTKTHEQKYMMQKLWDDSSATGTRPASITVCLYNGTALDRKVTLDAQNNWTYRWSGKSNWTVKEDSVPDGYTTSTKTSVSTKDGMQTTTFQITNKAKDTNTHGGTPGGFLPKTGDYLPILGLILIAIGAGIVVAALGRCRHAKKHGGNE